MEKRRINRLELVVHIVCWITIAGTAFWTLMLPYLCNMLVYVNRRGGPASWGEALKSSGFWLKFLTMLLPTAGVWLVLILALRLLSQVRKGRLFCRENVRYLSLAGVVGLLMSGCALFQAASRMELHPLAYVNMFLHGFPQAAALLLNYFSFDFLHFGFCLVGGLFCLLMAQFLRRGMALQEENDLTI